MGGFGEISEYEESKEPTERGLEEQPVSVEGSYRLLVEQLNEGMGGLMESAKENDEDKKLLEETHDPLHVALDWTDPQNNTGWWFDESTPVKKVFSEIDKSIENKHDELKVQEDIFEEDTSDSRSALEIEEKGLKILKSFSEQLALNPSAKSTPTEMLRNVLQPLAAPNSPSGSEQK